MVPCIVFPKSTHTGVNDVKPNKTEKPDFTGLRNRIPNLIELASTQKPTDTSNLALQQSFKSPYVDIFRTVKQLQDTIKKALNNYTKRF